MSASAKRRSAAVPKERSTESRYRFQVGRASSISYMTFIAFITERNAPETPHRVKRNETIAPAV
jgi:hypothetical protein